MLERAVADRQLVVGAVWLILLARLVDGPVSWLVAALLGLGVLVGAGWSRASDDAPSSDGVSAPPTRRFRAEWEAVVGGAAGLESGLVPAVLAASLALAVRLVPLDWVLVPFLVAAFVLLDRAIHVERSLARSSTHENDRWQAVLAVLATAFLGFAGVASMVSGGVAGIGGPSLGEIRPRWRSRSRTGSSPLLLGFRLARLGPATRREAFVSGLGFAAVVAIGAGLLRAMAIPQLVGPALLTLLVYLWDALNATTPSIRRDPRWRWQVGMLLVLSRWSSWAGTCACALGGRPPRARSQRRRGAGRRGGGGPAARCTKPSKSPPRAPGRTLRNATCSDVGAGSPPRNARRSALNAGASPRSRWNA